MLEEIEETQIVEESHIQEIVIAEKRVIEEEIIEEESRLGIAVEDIVVRVVVQVVDLVLVLAQKAQELVDDVF
jgi:hypothetical protein